MGGLTLQQVLKLLDEKHSLLDQTQPWPIKTTGFQEYALSTSITVDIVAARSMQWPGPGLSTGSHVEWKEGQ